MKSILVIADYKNWVFDTIYQNLKKHASKFKYDVWYQFDKTKQLHDKYSFNKFDYILYLCDYNLDFLIRNKIDPKKVILAIRSDVIHPIYTDKNTLTKLTNTLLVPNKLHYEKFKKYHDNVIIFSGGVDESIFKNNNKKEYINVIGWSGSRDNFGSEYRGLDLIESACNKLNIKFNPALREVRMRNREEMANYYNNEIGIYVDASVNAGRQNGLLEAAVSGVPIIATNVGVVPELIIDKINGVIIDRNVESIINAIKYTINNYDVLSNNIQQTIHDKWTWKCHVNQLEESLEKCLI